MTHPIPRRLPSLFPAVAAAVALLPFAASAQDQEDQQERPVWSTRASLGASLFFGNTSQTAVTTSASAERTSSVLGVTSQVAFTYGEAEGEDGVTMVNKRSWSVSTDLNFDPQETFNVFLRGKAEEVFEKRIDLRWNAGAGGRYQFLRSPTGQSDVSLAVLAEQVRPRPEADQENETVAKWSARFRYSREIGNGDSVTFQSDTSYEPELDDLGVFTLTSTNGFTFQLSEGLALQLQFVDEYDSEAESRGARTNNDGRLFFSVASVF